MTGTWRDTLFVWYGKLEIIENPSKSETSLVWQGTWMGCEDCADARSAAVPSLFNFSQSNMNFQVQGESKTHEKSTVLSLTSGRGWDLADGEDGSVHQYSDRAHDILLPHGLLSTKNTQDMNIASSNASPEHDQSVDDASSPQLVVAKGDNDFAPFISAGLILSSPLAISTSTNSTATQTNRSVTLPSINFTKDGKNHYYLLLGRRYLDSRDARTQWSLDQLNDKIREQWSYASPLDPQRQKNTNHDTLCFRFPQSLPPYAPWCVSSLEAAYRRKSKGPKAKRQRIDESKPAPLPPLSMPITTDVMKEEISGDESGSPDFDPKLQLQTLTCDPGLSGRVVVATNVLWDYQCWATGKSACYVQDDSLVRLPQHLIIMCHVNDDQTSSVANSSPTTTKEMSTSYLWLDARVCPSADKGPDHRHILLCCHILPLLKKEGLDPGCSLQIGPDVMSTLRDTTVSALLEAGWSAKKPDSSSGQMHGMGNIQRPTSLWFSGKVPT